MSISKIGKSLSESATLKMNAIAAALKAKGVPIIHLGGGEPTSKAPIDAIISAAAHLTSGEVRYAPADGIPELKKSIIKYTEEFYNHSVQPDNVIASSGAKQALMVALQAILDPGDEVVYPIPYWLSYPEMAKLCGAIPAPAPIKNGSFYPSLEDIEAKVDSKTRAIIINSPNNPTGAMFTEEFIAAVVNFCEKKDIYLIMDEIYHRLVFENKKPANCFKYAKDKSENSKLIVINGVSKQYAMTGFRIGWAIANKNLVKVMRNIQAHQTSGPSVILQKAAVGALNGDQSCIESLRLNLENNRNVLLKLLESFPGIKTHKPDGAFYCFADFSSFEKDSIKLATYLLEKAQVITVPGKTFGLDGFLRLSTCTTVKEITEGIDRIKTALLSYPTDEPKTGKAK